MLRSSEALLLGFTPPRYIWKLGTVQKGGPVITSSDEIGEAIPFEVVGTVLGTSTESLTQVLQRPRFGWPLAVCFCYRGICMIHITVVKLDSSLCSFTLSDA